MATVKTLKMTDIKTTGGGKFKKGVQNFSDFASNETHQRFDQRIDQTIYMVKLERMSSESYGQGWKVYYKDLPNAQVTYDCSVFGVYPAQQLENLYSMTHDGKTISLDSPIRTTIRAAGKSYKFE